MDRFKSHVHLFQTADAPFCKPPERTRYPLVQPLGNLIISQWQYNRRCLAGRTRLSNRLHPKVLHVGRKLNRRGLCLYANRCNLFRKLDLARSRIHQPRLSTCHSTAKFYFFLYRCATNPCLILPCIRLDYWFIGIYWIIPRVRRGRGQITHRSIISRSIGKYYSSRQQIRLSLFIGSVQNGIGSIVLRSRILLRRSSICILVYWFISEAGFPDH